MSAVKDVAGAEKKIRAALESSGEYGKMRAMVMEAALKSLDASSQADPSRKVFFPSPALTAAKASDEGKLALSLVLDYLNSLGLQHTASVLQIEASLSSVPLPSADTMQERLFHGRHWGHSAPPSPSCLASLLQASLVGGIGTGAAAVEKADKVELEQDDAPSSVARTNNEEVKEKEETSSSDHSEQKGQDTTYYISTWRDRTFTRENAVTGQQLQVEFLTDCKVVVLDELDSMTIDDCEGGEIIIAACEGSVFLRNCKNMTVHAACKQLRTRDCEHIQLHLFTSTDPVVEMSHHIDFYPFHLRLPALRSRFTEAHLDPKVNRFVHVYDFTPDEPRPLQPHFVVHYPDHGQQMESRCDTYGTPECPPEIEDLLLLRLLPAASSESGKNKSYDIRAGAAAWASAGADDEIDDKEDGSAKEGSFDKTSTSASSVVSEPLADSPVTHTTAPSAPPVFETSVPLPKPVEHLTGNSPASGGLNDQDYSSFSDASEDNDERDKYSVDEDEDDF